ncbi:MAG: nitroreductase [Desulfobacteraceae bacterium]|nr:nitroreductase [Desulfobacteraceae bacterium]
MTHTSFKELVRSNRSCRRFDNAHKLDVQTVKELIDLARTTASAANNQPLKYIITTNENKNDDVFESLGWAAYLTDWKGPVKEERPSAYIILMGDTSIAKNFWCDHGIAAQTILLGARDQGLAGCMFGAINKKKLISQFNIPDHLEILLVIALGKPAETIQIDPVKEDGSIKYWRDENQIHHVPKRALDDLIIATY